MKLSLEEKYALHIRRSIPENFEAQVAQTPDIIALKQGSTEWTYAQLNSMSNQLARSLLDRLGDEVVPIVILFGQEINAVVAIMGILKASKIFVSQSPHTPLSRIQGVCEFTEAPLIVTNNKHIALAKSLGRPILNLDEIDNGAQDSNPALPIPVEQPAGIYFTSGSTGKPKGVIRPHISFTWSTPSSGLISPGDRRSLLFDPGFGAAGGAIFGTLLHGGMVLPFDIKKNSLHALAKWFASEEINYANIPISYFREMVNTLSGDVYFPSMRRVILGGANLFARDLDAFWHMVPDDCVLLHEMATSETKVLVEIEIRKDDRFETAIIPAGYPSLGREVWLEDESGERVPAKEIGEIMVKSKVNALGYWKQPEFTRKKFMDTPDGERIFRTGDLGRFDELGRLHHLGRKDLMVKIRGYRVEISEVEAALFALDGIRSAVAAPHKRQNGEHYLVGYLIPHKEMPKISQIREQLAERLPDYMIPSVFMQIDELPLVGPAKVNRRALPAPEGRRPTLSVSYAAPKTETEVELARIWTNVLGLDKVGVQDSFVELGGHSIQASRIVAQVFKSHKVDLPIHTLLQEETIANMAALLERSKGEQINEEELEALIAELEEMSDGEAKLLSGE